MHNLGSDGPIRLNKEREDKYSGSSTLLHLPNERRGAECQDRKDKVYGLLGLASDARCFDIDYNKYLFEIWTDIMEFMNLHNLFSNVGIIAVGNLVKFLLMGAQCDPLQQILRTYEPRNGNDTIITDKEHCKAFKLPGVVLGCVVCVGPQPHEIIGNLYVVDQWIQQVQANYRDSLGYAHRESDDLISTILDLDGDSLSRKCFDCRSTIQWGHYRGDINLTWAARLQREARNLYKEDNSRTEQASANSPRLF
ncbi:hypothetical protein FVEN_g12692 [Fusarium venenatum]|uniref:uncharacterized protein n=1 Tax=Fusarium venenatum TaxID=56646 RepID=UPI001D9BAED9|nr:hypothetical protein FVEN_g12692 [Fusarium venenatum]KAH6979138.1 hypothetical protein EDB82DRAFT_477856 [Fusarium venenatum]